MMIHCWENSREENLKDRDLQKGHRPAMHTVCTAPPICFTGIVRQYWMVNGTLHFLKKRWLQWRLIILIAPSHPTRRWPSCLILERAEAQITMEVIFLYYAFCFQYTKRLENVVTFLVIKSLGAVILSVHKNFTCILSVHLKFTQSLYELTPCKKHTSLAWYAHEV